MHCKYSIKCLCLLIPLSGFLSACSVKDSAPRSYSKNWDEIPDAVPRDEAKSKYGNTTLWIAAKDSGRRAKHPGMAPSSTGNVHQAVKHTICMR